MRIALKDVAAWGNGQVFWVYEHVMAAIAGAILMVPVRLVDGSLRDVCALCPVPYQSALAVMDQERALAFEDVIALDLAPETRWPMVQAMAGEGAWFGAPLPEFKSRVYLHEHGTRLAVADEFLVRETLRSRHGQAAAS